MAAACVHQLKWASRELEDLPAETVSRSIHVDPQVEGVMALWPVGARRGAGGRPSTIARVLGLVKPQGQNAVDRFLFGRGRDSFPSNSSTGQTERLVESAELQAVHHGIARLTTLDGQGYPVRIRWIGTAKTVISWLPPIRVRRRFLVRNAIGGGARFLAGRCVCRRAFGWL